MEKNTAPAPGFVQPGFQQPPPYEAHQQQPPYMPTGEF